MDGMSLYAPPSAPPVSTTPEPTYAAPPAPAPAPVAPPVAYPPATPPTPPASSAPVAPDQLDSHVQRGRRKTVSTLIAESEQAIRAGARPGARVWSTGFGVLDEALTGGFRSGELILVAGAQGQGKTTMGMQMLRNAVASGRTGLMFSYELEAHSLLERLLALESGLIAEEAGLIPPGLAGCRTAFEVTSQSGDELRRRLQMVPCGEEALDRVLSYGSRLHIHEANHGTTLEEIRAAVDEMTRQHGEPPIVLIDYIQKVPYAALADNEEARVTVIAEGLKNLSLEAKCPVMAITAAEKESLGAGQRMRAHHLRGSSALAYEADVVVILSAKDMIVSREHLVYDLTAIERYKKWAVLSIEKNRHGTGQLDLEFEKDFASSRFKPEGAVCIDRLVEERVFTQ